MARNFAQIIFLVVAWALLKITKKHMVRLITRKMGKENFRRKVRGGANADLFLTVQDQLPPFLFYLNVGNYAFLAVMAVLHLVIGWFSFAAMFLKILNSLLLITSAVQAYLLTVLGNTMDFGEPFFLYRADQNPNHERAFASSVLDAIFYGILPLGLAICNYFLK